MTVTADGPVGQNLWKRADQVLPGGLIYLTRSARFAGEGVLPGFIRSGQGCRITDVDGKEYIDFLCGNGPNLLGYCHAEVDRAAQEQAAKADQTSFYPEAIVEYSEKLLAWTRDYQWVVHAKNGSDSIGLASRVMRQATGRAKIVLFQRAYHGFGSEFSLAFEQIPDTALKDVIRLGWNDQDALINTFKVVGKDIAGIIMNPLDQSPAKPTIEASSDFISAIKYVCNEYDALLTLDDVRHGFRLHPQGSHRLLEVEPDMICLGKALANGYACSALVGKEKLKAAAAQIQFTATYMFSAVAYQAAMATLNIYERDLVFAYIVEMGERLKDGLILAASEAGHEIVMSGPVTMPTLLFQGDRRGERARHFAREAAQRGAIFHPSLNWFLSAAHGKQDIDEAISIAAESFQATPVN